MATMKHDLNQWHVNVFKIIIIIIIIIQFTIVLEGIIN